MPMSMSFSKRFLAFQPFRSFFLLVVRKLLHANLKLSKAQMGKPFKDLPFLIPLPLNIFMNNVKQVQVSPFFSPRWIFHLKTRPKCRNFSPPKAVDNRDEKLSPLVAHLFILCRVSKPYVLRLLLDKWLTHFSVRVLTLRISRSTATPPLGSLRLVINLHHNYSSSR